MKPNTLKFPVVFAVIPVLLASCLKSPETPPPTPPQTFISLLHLAPTGPIVDVFFDDSKVSNTPFSPGNVTVGYNSVDKGTFAVRFKKTMSDSLVTEVPSALYDSLKFYTIVLYNTQTDGPVKALRITDDFTPIMTDQTKAYYRFFHASPNTGALDLYINDSKVATDRRHSDNTTQPLFNQFVATATGLLKIEVKIAGTDSTIASLTNVEARASNAYTIYLKGLDGGTGDKERTLQVLRAVN